MTTPLLVFFVLAVMAVLGAISLILQKHPIHSALSLIVVMVALAGLYLLMGAEFNAMLFPRGLTRVPPPRVDTEAR